MMLGRRWSCGGGVQGWRRHWQVGASLRSLASSSVTVGVKPGSTALPPGVEALLAVADEVGTANTRSFSIVAHIDHGKSTLADRLLELTGNINPLNKASAQVLDTLEVERERGITVKAQTASMVYRHGPDGTPYLLNLIDTPGHVDFSYEVSRALSACQGTLLLVDCAQGVQAQTVANYHAVLAAGLTDVVPVLTKVDLPTADPEMCLNQMQAAFGIDPDTVLWTSAKSGEGVDEVLPAVVERLPAPTGDRDAPTRCLLFDSWFDEYRGVVAIVSVIDGILSVGDSVVTTSNGHRYSVQEVGLVAPSRHPVDRLVAGQVGYVIVGMRSTRDALIGDTLCRADTPVTPLPGFQQVKPMVFASIFPVDSGDFKALENAVNKLLLTDSSVTAERETSGSLGMGLRCGFLGLLHMDVFFQRLAGEYDTPVISTAPMVPYEVVLHDGTRKVVEKPGDFPPAQEVETYYEPIVRVSVMTPQSTIGPVMKLLQDRRGEQLDMVFIDDERVSLQYLLPWQEIVTDFYDRLKSITSGYASLDYEPAEQRAANVVKVDVLLNGTPLEELSFVAHREAAETMGRQVAQRLKKVIKRQQFEVIIQAALGRKVFAKERIPPFRKDVLIKSGKTVGGGDVTRKRKLLEKQKRGKSRMKTVGRVELPQSAFHAVLQR